MNDLAIVTGDNVAIPGVCAIKQPRLSLLREVGLDVYSVYASIATMDPLDMVVESSPNLKDSELDEALAMLPKSMFDIFMPSGEMRGLWLQSLAFFIDGDLEPSQDLSELLVFNRDKEGSAVLVGSITADNYPDVVDVINAMTSSGGSKRKVPDKFASDRVRQIWWRTEFYHRKADRNKAKNKDEGLTLASTIATVCAYSPSYNYVNIWELTVAQLYDIFSRLIVKAQIDAYAVKWGAWGEGQFDISALYKPVK